MYNDWTMVLRSHTDLQPVLLALVFVCKHIFSSAVKPDKILVLLQSIIAGTERQSSMCRTAYVCVFAPVPRGLLLACPASCAMWWVVHACSRPVPVALTAQLGCRCMYPAIGVRLFSQAHRRGGKLTSHLIDVSAASSISTKLCCSRNSL